MYPSKLERSWGAAPHWISAVVHIMSAGSLTWLSGFIIHWLWKDRSKFVAFHALQVNYLGAVGVFLGIAAWLLHAIPLIGGLLAFAAGVSWLVTLGLLVVGALAAGRGEAFQFPVFGPVARRNVGL